MRRGRLALVASIFVASCSTNATQAPPVVEPPPVAPLVCHSSCAGGILYVSPRGNDAADGCSPATPLATISAALVCHDAHEVHVCAGTYSESLDLASATSLRGGYACDTFERKAPFGLTGVGNDGNPVIHPTNNWSPYPPNDWTPVYDTTNETVVVQNVARTTATLHVHGAAIDANVVIDGLHVIAPTTVVDDTANVSMVAVSLTDGASPTINDCVLESASDNKPWSMPPPQRAVGSAALEIGTECHPTVQANAMKARGGFGSKYDSAAVVVESGGDATLRGNLLDGSGAGIFATNPASLTVEGNHVSGLFAIDVSGDPAKKMRIASNRISGEAIGVQVVGIRADIDANLIYAGAPVGVATPTNSQVREYTTGIVIVNLGHGAITNNVVHGGNPKGAGLISSEGTSFSTGLVYGCNSSASDCSGELIAHNTIYSGSGQASNDAFSIGAADAAAITQIHFVDNLLLGWGPFSAGISVGSGAGGCPNRLFAELARNAFVPRSPSGSIARGGCPASAIATKLSDLPAMFSLPSTPGNVLIKPSCDGDPDCYEGASVIASWADWPNSPESTLFGPGWKVAAGVPCALANGGSASPPNDVEGAPRGATSAIGAYASAVGPCTP